MISRLKDTLLIVSDEAEDRARLREIFESSFNLLEAENVYQAIMLMEQNAACVVSVIIDLKYVDDADVQTFNRAACFGSDEAIPIVALVAPTGTGELEEQALLRGASDVVFKPYVAGNLLRRVQNIVDLFLHKLHLQNLVREQSETIRSTNQVMLDALSAIIEHRSTESGNHVLRIRRFTKILLEDVARNFPEYGLTDNEISIIAGAAALHDIGKISIPDAILNKPGKLTAEEFEIMKTHTTVGGELILNLSGMGDAEYLRYAYNIALHHHERWDGGGYPAGLAGEEIPICAQVVSVADVFDALTTPRVYKEAVPCEQAINMILNNECGKFSPKVLESFKKVRGQFVELAHLYSDGYSPKDDAITMPLPGPKWGANSLDTTQISHVKYQTLLHYLNDTVVEMDLEQGIYHVVYNPNPDLDVLMSGDSFEGISGMLKRVRIHPEDAGVAEEIRTLLKGDFFRLKLRRKSFFCRMFSQTLGEWQPYELIFLRVNTGNENQRVVTVVWHRLKEEQPVRPAVLRDGFHTSPALQGLVGAVLRCRIDEKLTIDAGAGELYLLTGYTGEEIERDFGGNLIALVDHRDREEFVRSAQEKLAAGGRGESEFRILRKDKEAAWVLARSRVYLEEDGEEYVYFSLQDNARMKAVEYELKNTIERNQVIINQSGGIVFEWNLKEDTMYCSHKWEERFGYTPVSRNYGNQLGIATHFHPDDLPLIRDAIEEIKTHFTSMSVDVRIADANARYLWTRVIATAYLNEEGELVRIIGILQDVDAVKRAEEELKEKAERDGLTKLYNKASAQKMITNYLAERDESAQAAMLILDLDNFKLINDHYGHLYGDGVLEQIGAGLRKLFRGNDILGRIGGDEFLILMKDIPGVELVHNRCTRVLKELHRLLEERCPGLNTSGSVGVALIPDHGTGYSDLFRRADEALYQSKVSGKDTYTVYDPKNAGNELFAQSGNESTRIETDKQSEEIGASFMKYVFRRLYESRDIIGTVDEIISTVGEQFGVSRVYIFENNEDNTTCSNTFEWCNRGISPEIDNLQNVSYVEDIAGWTDLFDENGVFYCTDIAKLAPHFRAILEPQGIKSMLQCSILDNGVFRGYVGFDECVVQRMWTQEQIELLQMLSEVMAMFLLKQRSRDRMAAQVETLRAALREHGIPCEEG